MKKSGKRIEVFLVRHAEAQQRQRGRRDATRQLTRKGRSEFRRAVRHLLSAGIRLDVILTSPWDRAAQTAEMLRPLCSHAPRPTVLLARAPGRALTQRIRGVAQSHRGDSTRVALVGHEPWLSELMHMLMRDPASHEVHHLRLRKGSVTRLTGTGGASAFPFRGQWDPRRMKFVIEHS